MRASHQADLFRRLHDAHVRAITAYCARRTSTERVDDAVSETFPVAWRWIDDLVDEDTALQRADFGWMTENVSEDSNSIAVSPDGIVWQEISVTLQPPEGAGGRNVTAVGNTIIPSQFEDFGDRTMWIGRVDGA